MDKKTGKIPINTICFNTFVKSCKKKSKTAFFRLLTICLEEAGFVMRCTPEGFQFISDEEHTEEFITYLYERDQYLKSLTASNTNITPLIDVAMAEYTPEYFVMKKDQKSN